MNTLNKFVVFEVAMMAMIVGGAGILPSNLE
jgi:hypothetical protein